MRFLIERHYKDDLTGKQFGELTVLEPDNSKVWHSKHWLCKCSCGKIVSVERKHLLDGSTKSCGHTKRQNGLDHTDNFSGMRDRQNKYNTNLEVIRNQKIQPNNTSGVKGVHYNKARKRWAADISIGGKVIRRDFKTKEEAIKYRQELVDKYYKPKIDQAIKAGDLKEEKENNFKFNIGDTAYIQIASFYYHIYGLYAPVTIKDRWTDEKGNNYYSYIDKRNGKKGQNSENFLIDKQLMNILIKKR